jgi:DNA-binding beta-propeller fold protein YncE
VDEVAAAVYSTHPGTFGFTVFDPARFTQRKVTFPGFAWSRRFGPNPPDHGLALLPNGRELWVLDAPNSVAHVYDVSGVPLQPPRHVTDVRFSKPISGDENPCAHPRCGRLGSLVASADGRYLYVGDSGDVIDVAKREVLQNLEALHQSRLALEVDWVDGKPEFPR